MEEKDYVAGPSGEITREEALAMAWALVEAMESRRLLDEAERPDHGDPPGQRP